METLVYYEPYSGAKLLHRPGSVGSVGVTAMQFRLKQSHPDDPQRFEKGTNDDSAWAFGTVVTSGTEFSPFTNTAYADSHTFQEPPGRYRNNGYSYTTLAPEDRAADAIALQIPYLSRKLQIDRINADSGAAFKDLPHGYAPPPGAVLRGGNYPREFDNEAPPGPAFEKFVQYAPPVNEHPIPLNIRKQSDIKSE